MGSIPVPGTKIPHALSQLSPRATSTEDCAPRWVHAPQQERPQGEAGDLNEKALPIAATREGPHEATKTQHSQKEN